jgi:hypothetical protein
MSRAVLVLVVAAWPVLGAQQPVQASGGTVTGFVTAQATGEPLGFADVTIEHPRRALFASPAGRFGFRDLPPGPTTIRVRRIGFQPATVRVTIVAGQEDTVRVALAPVALTLDRVRITDALCPNRSGGDTSTAAMLAQIRMNAERDQLLARQFPFVSSMERRIGYEVGGRGRIRNSNSGAPNTDTIAVSGDHEWRYAPGKLVVPVEGDPIDGAREKLMVPQLIAFADDPFIEAHCFRYAGLTSIDGATRIRVDFEPIKTLRESDVHGSMYLDSTSYQLVRTTLFMDRPSPKSPADRWDVRVDTWFREILPSLPVVDRLCMRTTGRTLTQRGEAAIIGSAALEEQRLIAFAFEHGGPAEAPRVEPSTTPACGGKR